jgi:hypothetical protein
MVGLLTSLRKHVLGNARVRKAGVTDLSCLSDADLNARMRDLSARLLGLPASNDPLDPDEQRLDERIRQLVASLAADGTDVKGHYGAPQ